MEDIDGNTKNNQLFEVKTFTVPFSLGEITKEITIINYLDINLSKQQIIKQAFKFHKQGNILEAKKYYNYFINKGFIDYRVFSNYGTILEGINQLKEAEVLARKVIELKPKYAIGYYNLGNILQKSGNFKYSEIFTRKAIELKPDFVEAYYLMGELLRIKGDLNQSMKISERIMSIRPWSILGSYSLNHKMKSNSPHN